MLTTRYDDGGYSGGNLERPALKRLLSHIEAGRVDCVLVYKVDRLSRSLLDFARLMETFDKHHVSFVSVTQQFNTSTSMGRLVLHVLLSFAQFERELISERTRHNMGAARCRGRWLGGRPVLGYEVDREKRRLVVSPHEAERVRAIFQLYLELGSLVPTTEELARRGWFNKEWTTQQGKVRGGRPFGKATLHYLLTNPTYVGRVNYEGKNYPGEQEAVVSASLFRRVQAALKKNRRSRPHAGCSPLRGLLQGLLHCAHCEAPMRHTYTCKGSLRYRYYMCPRAKKHDRDGCHATWISAPKIEAQVLQEIESHLATETGQEVWRGRDVHGQTALVKQIVARVQYDPEGTELTIQLEADALRSYFLAHEPEPAL